jgi:hypothetical protein
MIQQSDKSKSASPKTKPREVTESVAPSVQASNGVPVTPLGDDMIRYAEDILGSADHTCGPLELGEYVAEDHVTGPGYKPRNRRDGQAIGGNNATIAFDDSYFWFFERFSPAMRIMVLHFGQLFTGEAGQRRLSALVEVAEERVEAKAAQRRRKRFRRSMVVLFVGTVAFARYFVEQATWVVEKLPFIKELWRMIFNIKGGG